MGLLGSNMIVRQMLTAFKEEMKTERDPRVAMSWIIDSYEGATVREQKEFISLAKKFLKEGTNMPRRCSRNSPISERQYQSLVYQAAKENFGGDEDTSFDLAYALIETYPDLEDHIKMTRGVKGLRSIIEYIAEDIYEVTAGKY